MKPYAKQADKIVNNLKNCKNVKTDWIGTESRNKLQTYVPLMPRCCLWKGHLVSDHWVMNEAKWNGKMLTTLKIITGEQQGQLWAERLPWHSYLCLLFPCDSIPNCPPGGVKLVSNPLAVVQAQSSQAQTEPHQSSAWSISYLHSISERLKTLHPATISPWKQMD